MGPRGASVRRRAFASWAAAVTIALLLLGGTVGPAGAAPTAGVEAPTVPTGSAAPPSALTQPSTGPDIDPEATGAPSATADPTVPPSDDPPPSADPSGTAGPGDPTTEPSAPVSPQPSAPDPTPSGPVTASPPTVGPTSPGEPTPVPSDAPVDEPPTVGPTPTPPTPSVQSAVLWVVPALAAAAAADATPAVAPLVEAVPVTVRTVCRAVVFANPDPTRPAVVAFGDFGSDAPDRVVTVRAGRAVRVPVDRPQIDWAAERTGRAGARLGAAGRGEGLDVDQDCAPPARAVTAVVSAPCLARRSPVTAMVAGAHPAADLRWWVTRRGASVTLDDGVLLAGRPTPVELGSAGPGEYVLTVAQGRRILDEAEFVVQECVTTAATCAAVTWTNPAVNAAVTVAFRDGARPWQAVRLEPGQSVLVRTRSAMLPWAATAALVDGARLSDAGASTETPETDCLPAPGGSVDPGAPAEPSGAAPVGADPSVPVEGATAGRGSDTPSGATGPPNPGSATAVVGWIALIGLLAAAVVAAGGLSHRRRRG